jgi:CRP-like cAMP-binding protein
MRRREIDAQRFLASLPLFEAVDAATLARLAAATERRPLARGERLFSVGDTPTGMYLVVFGEIRLVARGSTRGDRLVGVATAGQAFGEPVMFLERPALVDAEAASDALVLHVPKHAVFAEIERDPRFARRMIAGLSRRVEGLVQEQERQALVGGRERLLDYLERQAQGSTDGSVTLPASKAAVASHLHLTAEHFSRLLHELAAQGLVRVERRRITLVGAAAAPRKRASP